MKLYEIQPAYKIYAFDRGWRIMKYVSENLFKRTDVSARWWFDKAKYLLNRFSGSEWYIKYCIYVVVGGLGLAGGAQYVSAMVLVALFIAVQAIILSIWATISSVLMGILAGANFVYARFYRIFYRCPDCHKEMPIPVYICPTCRTEHTRLWPSIYGVFTHRCITCETKLATLGAGRKKLARICANADCRRPLNEGVGAGTNLHVPIVGGPSTGKTNLIVMATHEFLQRYQTAGYAISFTDTNHQRAFEENMARLTQGRALVKTPDIVPQAYNLSIKAPRALVPTISYVYDAAGEAFNDSMNTESQSYYKYIDGILFVIDPTAIPTFHNVHEGTINLLQDSLRPGTLDVMQTYERMKEMLQASIGGHKSRRDPHPIAVVITKVDALDLEQEIGQPAAQALMAQNPAITSEEDAISTLARDFLNNYGLDNFVRELEMSFANVRYFSCSALGRLPSLTDSSSFMPIRAAEPLIWLLAQAKAIKPLQQTIRTTSQLAPIGQAAQAQEAMQMQQRF